MSTDNPYTSIIICTIDRYDELTIALDALTVASNRAAAPHEIIVIDQTNPPKRRLDLHETYRFCRFVNQEEKGLSNARNLGFAHSKGEIVAYLDDDAVVCADWIDRMSEVFVEDKERKISACGGRVLADYRKGTKPAWMAGNLEHYLSCIDWGDTTRPLQPGEWIVGANMAFRRSVLADIKMFDTSLGRKGTKHLLSNEEIGLIEKVGRDRILYHPRAEILHLIAIDRLQQKWFRRRVYWQAISDLIADVDWMPQKQAWMEFSAFVAGSPAERRTMLALFDDCGDPERFEQQLRAIYAWTILGSGGFCIPE